MRSCNKAFWSDLLESAIRNVLHRRCQESKDLLKEVPDVVSKLDSKRELTSKRFNEIFQKSNDEM
jgi:hypothetical protein